MKGICALYGNETDLMESHIFPKFVIKHTKKTGSKFLRKLVEPNKREQDGIKHHLLSFKAEQDFAVREKWFAEKIFHPFLEGTTELEYNENLYYFSISFLWRILLSEFRTTENIKKRWYFELLQEVEEEWKFYLRTDTIPGKFHNVNLFLTDRIKSHSTDLKGVDFYFTRALDGTIVSGPSKEYVIVYGKFNRFVFWSVIKSPGYLDELYDVEIHPKGGSIEIPQRLEYEPITTFMTNRIKKIAEFPLPSEAQQDRIVEEIMKDPESFWKSDIGRSMYNDRFNLEK
ncbi:MULTISPECIES: hypothetical protein [Flavobacteriaceae]|jgi:hypothetical protein|uniref:Uncharacterized protein n=3 Tax=Flavobacteriaceae TaxID=49546 RepID=A0A223VAI8_9FLAO|nr:MULTISPECIES: hypothetical protein [Flavobacteriaceae]ASV32346.1 hypothetical protein CJ263_20115 [Maribacter cobaltidurans]MDC6388692.1 hypothetical protein [Maribacter sp. PR1]MDF0716547.1 hypothetical protein [[Muricauda] yonaguniensis]MEE1976081.1 hypothetical protein [Maribacter cobaltidurans]GGD94510.1 hypothetical protein GCM10011412_35640 [Maribacter cobaltidurans]